jgi:hypothetical protein
LHHEVLNVAPTTAPFPTITVNACSADEAAAMAALIFEKDTPFVPVIPLASLAAEHPPEGSARGYFGAYVDGAGIRALTAYEHWIEGCDSKDADRADDIAIYELAASVVRHPLGGFDVNVLSLQQVFIFVRLAAILFDALVSETPQRHCILACVAATNTQSLLGLTSLGFLRVEELPKWLKYEHRYWFPKYDGEPAVGRDQAQIDSEGVYLWAPPSAVKALFATIAPYVDGEKTESFALEVDTLMLRVLRENFGSLARALDHLKYDCLVPPPPFVRIGEDVF